jgi:hypothetical protein
MEIVAWKFWIYKDHFGNTCMYFFPRIMYFQHWKNKDKYLTIPKAAVLGSNPMKASIPSWQH